MTRRRDSDSLPRPLVVALALVALVFAGLWSKHHGFLELGALRDVLRAERFALRQVDFLGTSLLDPDTLWSSVGIPAGTALVDVDPDAVAGALAAHPRIARVRVARLLPDRLVIGVSERVPVALDMSTGLGLAEDGARFPLEAGEADLLPQVSGEARRALPVIAAARAHGVELATVDAPRSRAVRVRAVGRPTVLVLGRNQEASLADWTQLAGSGLVESTGAREVDLRFRGNPVLRGFPKSTGGGNGETR